MNDNEFDEELEQRIFGNTTIESMESCYIDSDSDSHDNNNNNDS